MKVVLAIDLTMEAVELARSTDEGDELVSAKLTIFIVTRFLGCRKLPTPDWDFFLEDSELPLDPRQSCRPVAIPVDDSVRHVLHILLEDLWVF